MRRTWIIGMTAALALAMSACGSSPSSTVDSEATTAASASATAGEPAGSSTGDPNAIAAIGHSSVTGYNSDNADLTRDARENSWATGTNPEVNSLYARILARNPAVKDHNRNAAEDGSTVYDLRGQVDTLLASDPKPDLVLITALADRSSARHRRSLSRGAGRQLRADSGLPVRPGGHAADDGRPGGPDV